MNIIKEFEKEDGIFKKDAVIYARKNKKDEANKLLKVLDDFANNLDKYNDKLYPLSIPYALYLLSEFKDQRAYPILIKMLKYKIPDKKDFYDFYGDIIAEHFACHIVSTFNGDLSSLYDIVKDESLDKYSRKFSIEALAYLCKQKIIERKEFLNYIEKSIEKYKDNEDLLMGFLDAATIINAIELIKPLRKLFIDDLVDLHMYGKFDEYLNWLLNEKSYDVYIIEDTIKEMSWWAIFNNSNANKNFDEKFIKLLEDTTKNIYKNVGRNDPCPCGSGKKYKKCCLNNVKEGLPYQNFINDDIKKFPNALYNFYKKEFVDMDYLLFKALTEKHIPITIERNKEKELKIDLQNLRDAFEMFKQIIKDNNIKTVEEYDDKVAIHYTFYEFIYGYLNKLDDYVKYDKKAISTQKEIADFISKNFKVDKELTQTFIFIDCLTYVYEGKIEEGITKIENKIKKAKDRDDKIELYDDLFYLCSELNEKHEVIEDKINTYIEKAPKELKEDLTEISTDYLY